MHLFHVFISITFVSNVCVVGSCFFMFSVNLCPLIGLFNLLTFKLLLLYSDLLFVFYISRVVFVFPFCL